MKKLLKLRGFLFVIIHMGMWSYGQDEVNKKSFPDLSIYGFMDVFNVYDFSNPQAINRQDFLFNHNRHNEFNVNLALLKFDLQHSSYRASFGLQTGTYVNDNMSAEPLSLKHIFEANIGVSLNKRNSLWLDAGVLPSHIGFESAISMDNFTLTRSLLAENSPYFLTGASLSFYPNDRLELKVLVINGWQRIQRLEGNSLPSFGTQIKFSPKKQLSINWSTFIGTDENDENRKMRYFSNLYGQFQISKKLEFVVALDFGFQQHSKGSSDHDFWVSPIAIGQFNINEKWKSALRIEYYQDKESVITPALSQNGIQLTGASLNFDYTPNENIICRVEGRWMNNKDGFIGSMGNSFNDNLILATSVAIKLSRTELKNVDNQNW